MMQTEGLSLKECRPLMCWCLCQPLCWSLWLFSWNGLCAGVYKCVHLCNHSMSCHICIDDNTGFHILELHTSCCSLSQGTLWPLCKLCNLTDWSLTDSVCAIDFHQQPTWHVHVATCTYYNLLIFIVVTKIVPQLCAEECSSHVCGGNDLFSLSCFAVVGDASFRTESTDRAQSSVTPQEAHPHACLLYHWGNLFSTCCEN